MQIWRGVGGLALTVSDSREACNWIFPELAYAPSVSPVSLAKSVPKTR